MSERYLCYWGWCRQVFNSDEDLCRHFKSAHSPKFTAIKRGDWDIWVRAHTGQVNLPNRKPTTSASRNSRTQWTHTEVPRSSQSPVSNGSRKRKRSFLGYVAQSSPAETPLSSPSRPSPELTDLISFATKRRNGPGLSASPPLIARETLSPPRAYTNSNRRSQNVSASTTSSSLSQNPSNGTSISAQDVEAQLTQVLTTSASPSTHPSHEPEHPRAQSPFDLAPQVPHSVSDRAPRQSPSPSPAPRLIDPRDDGHDEEHLFPQSHHSPPPPRHSMRARSQTPNPVPVPTVVKQYSRRPRKANRGMSHDERPPTRPMHRSASRATSRDTDSVPKTSKKSRSNSRNGGSHKRKQARVDVAEPIDEAEEDRDSLPLFSTEVRQSDANKTEGFVANTFHRAGNEKRNEPEESSQGSATSFTHYTAHYRNGTLDYSQLPLQTQAPYQSQIESQSQ